MFKLTRGAIHAPLFIWKSFTCMILEKTARIFSSVNLRDKI